MRDNAPTSARAGLLPIELSSSAIPGIAIVAKQRPSRLSERR
jgi:hypothetical protein